MSFFEWSILKKVYTHFLTSTCQLALRKFQASLYALGFLLTLITSDGRSWVFRISPSRPFSISLGLKRKRKKDNFIDWGAAIIIVKM